MIIKCKMCGTEFEHKKRGKKPVICKQCKIDTRKQPVEKTVTQVSDTIKRTLYSIVNTEGRLLSNCKFECEKRAMKFAIFLDLKNFTVKKEIREIPA